MLTQKSRFLAFSALLSIQRDRKLLNIMLKKLKTAWANFRETQACTISKWGIGLSTAFFVLFMARAEYVLWRADKVMTEKGYSTLAAELIYPYRHAYTCRTRACRIMLTAFFEGRFLDRADWAAQACLDAGVETPEAYLVLAGVRDSTNRGDEALMIYRMAVQKFPQDANVLFKAARMQAKSGMLDEAEKNMSGAAQLLPQNLNVQIDTLSLLLQRKKWSEARVIADRLKSSQQKLEAQIHVLMAYAYSQTKDQGSVQEQIKTAAAGWGSLPQELRDSLNKLAPEIVDQVGKEAGAAGRR